MILRKPDKEDIRLSLTQHQNGHLRCGSYALASQSASTVVWQDERRHVETVWTRGPAPAAARSGAGAMVFIRPWVRAANGPKSMQNAAKRSLIDA